MPSVALSGTFQPTSWIKVLLQYIAAGSCTAFRWPDSIVQNLRRYSHILSVYRSAHQSHTSAVTQRPPLLQHLFVSYSRSARPLQRNRGCYQRSVSHFQLVGQSTRIPYQSSHNHECRHSYLHIRPPAPGAQYTLRMDAPLAHAVANRKPVPEIDFTLHTMEDGSQVSTQERVCKGDLTQPPGLFHTDSSQTCKHPP